MTTHQNNSQCKTNSQGFSGEVVVSIDAKAIQNTRMWDRIEVPASLQGIPCESGQRVMFFSGSNLLILLNRCIAHYG